MKKSKRLLALTLSAAMALSLAACGGAGDDDAQGGEQGGETAELTEFIDWQLQSNEMTDFMPLHSEEAVNGRVLQNVYEGLLTRDNHQRVIPLIATDYTHSEDGMTWTFTIRSDVKWVDVNSEVKADLDSEDFLTGMEWILNYWKNDAKNVSMLVELIDGAQEYYDYTKGLTQEEAYALKGTDEKFQSMVGIEAPDATTLVYHLTKAAPYFHTVIMGTCGYPLCQDQVDEMGVDGVKSQNNETMWYNGPYVISEFISGNSKTLTPNTNYWNPDCKRFESVTVVMVEDATKDDQLFMNGEIDRCDLNISTLRTIYEDENHAYHDRLVQPRVTSANYTFMFNYDKQNADGTPDTNWNTAIANEAFRQAIRYGVNRTPIFETANFVDPAACREETFTTRDLVNFTSGQDYVDRVVEILGYDGDRYDADKAAEYVAQAKEELTAQGVTFPVQMDFYIKSGDQTALDNATVMKQQVEAIAEGFITMNIGYYVTNQTQEILNLHLHSFVQNGWIADYTDPENFLNQIVLNNDNAYYANRILFTNDLGECEARDQWQTFTDMAAEANAIIDDMDARYEAQAQAEAYALGHALIIPIRNQSTWSMTKANTYAVPRASTKYVGWETTTDPKGYTSDQYAELKAAFDAEVAG